jgi:hypothetical protein
MLATIKLRYYQKYSALSAVQIKEGCILYFKFNHNREKQIHSMFIRTMCFKNYLSNLSLCTL